MTVAELSEYIMISKKEIKKRLYVSARLFAIIGWASHPIGHVVYLPTQYKSNYGRWYDLIGNAKVPDGKDGVNQVDPSGHKQRTNSWS